MERRGTPCTSARQPPSSGDDGLHIHPLLEGVGTWARSQLPPSQALRRPAPRFKKPDESLVDEEYTGLEA